MGGVRCAGSGVDSAPKGQDEMAQGNALGSVHRRAKRGVASYCEEELTMWW